MNVPVTDFLGQHMFPGTDLTNSQPELMELISLAMNPHGLHPYHAMCLSKRVDKQALSDIFSDSDRLYIYYTRHDVPKKNRVFLADRSSTIDLLVSRINPERQEGLDLVITTLDLDRFLICSHDGDLFFREPSTWTQEMIDMSSQDDNITDCKND